MIFESAEACAPWDGEQSLRSRVLFSGLCLSSFRLALGFVVGASFDCSVTRTPSHSALGGRELLMCCS